MEFFSKRIQKFTFRFSLHLMDQLDLLHLSSWSQSSLSLWFPLWGIFWLSGFADHSLIFLRSWSSLQFVVLVFFFLTFTFPRDLAPVCFLLWLDSVVCFPLSLNMWIGLEIYYKHLSTYKDLFFIVRVLWNIVAQQHPYSFHMLLIYSGHLLLCLLAL